MEDPRSQNKEAMAEIILANLNEKILENDEQPELAMAILTKALDMARTQATWLPVYLKFEVERIIFGVVSVMEYGVEKAEGRLSPEACRTIYRLNCGHQSRHFEAMASTSDEADYEAALKMGEWITQNGDPLCEEYRLKQREEDD